MDDHDPQRAAAPHVGLLLVGHGSRDDAGVDEFLAVVRRVAAQAVDCAVEACFLEFAEPTIGRGFERLAQRGARRIIVVPLMLFAARHIRQDIPRQVAAIAARYPHVALGQAAHLGCHPAIVELSAQRFSAAVAGRRPLPPEDTILVMVGRGSRDAEATDEMLRFARLRGEAAPVAQVQTGFLAMAEPRWQPVLTRAAQAARRVVVQPHLLFAGQLLLRVQSTVDDFARRYPAVEWLVTEHLGPAALVASAALERARAAAPETATAGQA
jgi:sirohydrochlorin ferrochelatase